MGRNDTPGLPPLADVLRRADERREAAQRVIERLRLLERWAEFGRPVLVGSVAYDLVVAPDIDLEIYCARPRIEDGFAVVAGLALEPGIRKIRFANELQGPDRGLYWQVRYRDPASSAQEDWKIDMWSLGDDHPGPRSMDLVEAMHLALTHETRAAILRIKEATRARERVHGIDIYRAVLEGNARTVGEFEKWFALHEPVGLTAWRPGVAR